MTRMVQDDEDQDDEFQAALDIIAIFLIIFFILLVLLLVDLSCQALEISGDYTGQGSFSIRDDSGSSYAQASGVGEIAFGHKLNGSEAFEGFDFDGSGGRFLVLGRFGPAHMIQASNLSNISAKATVTPDHSLYQISGSGNFKELVLEMGKFGRPEERVRAEMAGDYEINSSVWAEPPEINIMDRD